jgi:ATP-dependent Zn protease
VAAPTLGFTGSDLAKLINEGSLIATCAQGGGVPVGSSR